MEEDSKTTEKAGKQHTIAATFVCDLKPGAEEVYLVGDFNGWDPRADRMQKRSGRFQKKVRVTPGEHQYKFVVDGEWYADPAAEMQVPNKHGTTNSVIKV